MAAVTKDMTRGNPWKLIAGFAFPVFLSQLFQQLYNTADSLIVGRFLGTEALAAVSSSGTLIFLLISFFSGISMGAGVVISRYFGAGDNEGVSKAVHSDIALGIISGVFLTVAGVLLTPTILQWMQTDPDVMPDAVEYFRYYFLGAIAVVLYSVCMGIMNALGDSRRPLKYLIISSCVNVALDVVFIGVIGWGVWAAAAATAISQALSVVLCFIHLMKPGTVFQVSLKRIRMDRATSGEIIKNGVPSGIQNSVISIANVIVQTSINSFGKAATAAYGTYSKIEGFAFLPITSFTMALTTYVSQNLGAREYDRAIKGSRFGILAAVLIAELVGLAIYLGAPVFAGAFSDDPEVIMLAVRQQRTIALFYGLLAFSHAVASVCRGAGKAFVPMVIMLSVWCVFRIAYITIVMHFFDNIEYIYWAYPITWSISTVIYFIYYMYSDWIHGFEKRPGK